jgi:hypothetical protein
MTELIVRRFSVRAYSARCLSRLTTLLLHSGHLARYSLGYRFFFFLFFAIGVGNSSREGGAGNTSVSGSEVDSVRFLFVISVGNPSNVPMLDKRVRYC